MTRTSDDIRKARFYELLGRIDPASRITSLEQQKGLLETRYMDAMAEAKAQTALTKKHLTLREELNPVHQAAFDVDQIKAEYQELQRWLIVEVLAEELEEVFAELDLVKNIGLKNDEVT